MDWTTVPVEALNVGDIMDLDQAGTHRVCGMHMPISGPDTGKWVVTVDGARPLVIAPGTMVEVFR